MKLLILFLLVGIASTSSKLNANEYENIDSLINDEAVATLTKTKQEAFRMDANAKPNIRYVHLWGRKFKLQSKMHNGVLRKFIVFHGKSIFIKSGATKKGATKKGIKNGPHPLVKKEIAECLTSINSYRRKHVDTKDLTWDAEVAKHAQEYAEKVLKDIVDHNGDMKYFKHDGKRLATLHLGQNIYYSDNSKMGTCADAANKWYSEVTSYDFKHHKAKPNGVIGHFTQLVWRGSKRFGLGIAVADSIHFATYGNKITVVVANFKPRGNYMAKTRTEVGQLI